MTDASPKGPLRRLHAEPDEGRVAALWQRIERSRARGLAVPAHPRGPWDRKLVGLAGVAAAAGVWVGIAAAPTMFPDASRMPALTLASGEPIPDRWVADAPRTYRLSDGSELRLSAGAQLTLIANEMGVLELAQRRGRVAFDVQRQGRRWLIDAGEAAVEVLGTRFQIERDDRGVRVGVRSGVVLVRSAQLPDGVRRLEGGQHLRVTAPEPRSVAPQERAPRQARAMPWVPPRGVDSVPADAEQNAEPTPDGSPGADERGLESVSTAVLLRRADRARRAGRRGAAARLLQAVVDRDDGRSAIAAFTLGKLRMPKDPARAARDFRAAVRLGLAEPLRQLAYRRRVEALMAAGRDAQAARGELQAAYPDAGLP
jgi:hypothetical protein